MRCWLLLCIALHLSFGVNAQIDSISKKKAKKAKILVFPVLGKAPETSWILGVAAIALFKTKHSDSLLRISTVPIGIIYSVKHQITLSNGVNIYFPKEKYIFRLENIYTKFPDRFWGLGYNTPNSNMETYTYSQLFINPQFLKKVYKDYFVGVCVEYQNTFYIHYTPGGLFDQENIIGKNGSRNVGAGFELSRDTRNNTFSATKGSLIRILTVAFNKILGSQYNFFYTQIDVRKYLPLNQKNVLAFQFSGTFTDGKATYRDLASLGGANMMRGYYAGRYRDNNSIAIQVEERMHLWWRFGLVAFAGLGQVSNDLTHWHFMQVKYSIGGGLRIAILPKEKLNLRMDYGFGYKAQNFYLTVTESF